MASDTIFGEFGRAGEHRLTIDQRSYLVLTGPQRPWALLLVVTGGPPVQIGGTSTFPSGRVHYAITPVSNALMLVDEEGSDLLWVDGRTGRWRSIHTLARWRTGEESYDPGGMYHLALHGIDGGILVEYECGVVAINDDGTLRWSRTFTCFSAFLGLRHESVWFEGNMWEGVEWEGEWGYRLIDGERVT